MLSKEVCKKCLLKYGRDWNLGRENNWEKYELITCDFKESGYMYRSFKISEVPSHCPYKMEHIIMEQNNEKTH